MLNTFEIYTWNVPPAPPPLRFLNTPLNVLSLARNDCANVTLLSMRVSSEQMDHTYRNPAELLL